MANRQNKIAKKNWKVSQMASLLAEALLKGEVSPFSYCLRDEAVTLFKRKFVYGKFTPCLKTVKFRRTDKVKIISGRIVLRNNNGKLYLAPLG